MPTEATTISKKFGRYGTAKSMPTTAVSKISETTFNLHNANKSLTAGKLVIVLSYPRVLKKALKIF